MENAIILQNVTVAELEILLVRVVNDQLKEFFNTQPTDKKEVLLTRDEACSLLKISSTSLWKWTKNGKINAYSLGNCVYYKKAELIESVKRIN